MKLAHRVLTYAVISTLYLAGITVVYAFPSASTNFHLEGEFGDFGGEKNSTNFKLTDTGGGLAPGFNNSTNYIACSGFQCTLSQVPTITFSLSSNTVALGTLTTGAVNTGNHTATVTTNWNGYALTALQDGNLCRTPLPCTSANDINAVAASPITAGTEAYGIATSASGQTITQDTSCGSAPYNATALSSSTPKTVASSTVATSSSGDTTTICYAAGISSATAAGNYSQKVTFIATGSF